MPAIEESPAIQRVKSVLDRTLEASHRVRFGLAEKSAKESKRKIMESFRIDLDNDKEGRFNMQDPFFSFKSLRESCARIATREASGAAMFSALLKAGINNVANEWYQLTDTVYEQIVQVTPSTHTIEPYAPMARGSTPRRPPRGTPFQNTKMPPASDIQKVLAAHPARESGLPAVDGKANINDSFAVPKA